MTKPEFLNLLNKHGFPEPVLVEQSPNGYLDSHTHDFEVLALVIEGSIDIEIGGNHTHYLIGDVFHLDFKQAHTERYSENGVKYLASRKRPQAH